MCKAVKDLLSPAELPAGLTVILLIEEEAGLLTFRHIHKITDPVLRDGNECVKGFSYEPLLPLHPLLQALLRVTPLIDPPDHNAIFSENLHKDVEDLHFQAVHTEGERFDDKNVPVLIDRYPGEKISVSENDPAASGINDRFAITPGVHETAS